MRLLRFLLLLLLPGIFAQALTSGIDDNRTGKNPGMGFIQIMFKRSAVESTQILNHKILGNSLSKSYNKKFRKC